MLGNDQSSPLQHPSQVFSGIHFLLLGFDPITKTKVLQKLLDGGGVDAGHYGPNCTHLIVDKLVYDDPICVAARLDGKILVSGLWVDHSFDVGMPVDTTSVLYRPMKDLNGIPGAQSLVICLTGYQRQDRDDIMKMVGLMGANFSKPLIANKVTHLICYKFEGEKYELAKKIRRIKLVNHRWLEDCLKAWEIVSEADYDKSGYELETLEAEAKDSEEEAEGSTPRQCEGKRTSPHHSLMLKQEISGNPSNTSASKGSGNARDKVSVTLKSTSDQTPNPHEISGKHPEVLGLGFSRHENVGDVICELPNQFEGTVSSSLAEKNCASSSRSANKSPPEVDKFTSISYSRKTPKRTTPPTIEMASNLSRSRKLSKLNLSAALNRSSSPVEQAKDENETASLGIKTPTKASALFLEEDRNDSFTGKRKIEISSGSSKMQKTGHNEKAVNRENSILTSAAGGLKPVLLEDPLAEMSNRLSPANDAPCSNSTVAVNPPESPPSNVAARKSSSFKGKSVADAVPLLETFTSEIVQGDLNALQISPKGFRASTSKTKVHSVDVGAESPERSIHEAQELRNEMQGVEISDPATKRPEVENSSASPDLEVKGRNAESNEKPARRKSVGKKFSAAKQNLGKKKTANQKGSIYLKNSEPRNDAVPSIVEHHEPAYVENSHEAPPCKLGTEIEVEVNDVLQSAVCMGDETEPPEDTEETADKQKQQEGKAQKTRDIATRQKAKGNIQEALENDDRYEDRTKHGKSTTIKDKVRAEKSDDKENLVKEKTTRRKKLPMSIKAKKSSVLTVKEVTDKKVAKAKELASDKSMEVDKADANQNDEKNEVGTERGNLAFDTDKVVVEMSAELENHVKKKSSRGKKCLPSKKINEKTVNSVREVTDMKAANRNELANCKNKELGNEEESAPSPAEKTIINENVNDLHGTVEPEEESRQIHVANQSTTKGNKLVGKSAIVLPKKTAPMASTVTSDPMKGNSTSGPEARWFILTGHKLQRKEFQQVIRRLKGRVCRVSHQWSYQATHFIVPDPIRRTEKFFAAAASGRWILKTDYLSASNQAGKFLEEEPYEWHKDGPSEDGQIDLEAPRKWRLLKQKTGHGAFYGMRIIVYGECIAPPLDTVKRVVKAGDGTILATSPPYTRFLDGRVDFAIVSPSMPDADTWIQEFLSREIPCVTVDYLVEYVCKPGHPLDRHVQYDTHAWAQKSLKKLKARFEEEMEEPRTPEDCNANDIACEVCGSRERGEEMLICGDESGSSGCGVGTHIDCCDPPLEDVPEEDWFCPNCSKNKNRESTTTTRLRKGTKRKTSA